MAYALRYLIWLVLAMAGGMPAGFGQAAPSEQRVRFTIFCTRPVVGLSFLPAAEAVPVSLVFYPSTRSPRYDYRGAMPLQLIDGQTREVQAEAVIPEGMTDVLLILVPMEPPVESGLRYQVFVLPDGGSERGAGSFAIINFSGLRLSGTLNGTPVELASGLNAVRSQATRTKLNLRTKFRNRSYQAYVGEVALEKGERGLLLLLPPVGAGSLEVQSRLLVDELPESDTRTGK